MSTFIYSIINLLLKKSLIEKPRNISATVDSNSSTINWEEPKSTTRLVGYIIYKDGKEFAKVDRNTTTYKIEDLRKNTLYGFKVVSKYSNGELSKPISVNVRTKK